MSLTRSAPSCTFPVTCRSCKDPILWVEWPQSGRRMPIDALPSKQGDIVVTLNRADNKLTAEKFNPELHEGRRLFISHFATCIHADEHRRDE